MKNWDDARKWADTANQNKDGEWAEPHWKWDCGLKLDFDGGLLRTSSRFYQEREGIFGGSVSFYIGDEELFNREFSLRHIDRLKDDVEEYVKGVTKNVQQLLESNRAVFITLKAK